MTKRKTKTIGGGSGGGTDAGALTATHQDLHSLEGAYSLKANQIGLLAHEALPPATPIPTLISIAAVGETDGQVEVRGSKGVRITAAPIPVPPASSDSTNGVEIIVGETQNVTIQRGIIPEVDQKIEMTPSGIVIDGGVGSVTIKSLTQITLSVCEGLATITLTPAGITIQGILIQIN